jgi:hypothetical protein
MIITYKKVVGTKAFRSNYILLCSGRTKKFLIRFGRSGSSKLKQRFDLSSKVDFDRELIIFLFGDEIPVSEKLRSMRGGVRRFLFL